ncbi:HAD domain-containing protein [Streptomyces sp. LHD-70]|uniref:HAD domain-containing protein n=1 Tax=Streptomyces sp. LHD-70 TaxID=3072140 RepID=UPI00280D4BA2|nr:HAD domain-containing protein [Streptomyces sp. LHD-70]MDQ8704798.1 HAD domain-containing protein [Streptomyces sp. LHD-70]
MTPPRPRALLFLDVDGPLIPFGASPADLPEGYPTYEGGTREGGGHPFLDRADPALGRRLADLGCELVWATTWGEDANRVLAPWLGLPESPVLPWPDETDESDGGRTDRTDEAYGAYKEYGAFGARGVHWKTRPIVEWADGRPFVWVDDEIAPADRAWVDTYHRGPALLHRVDARCGLTGRDFGVIRGWLGRLHPGFRGRD